MEYLFLDQFGRDNIIYTTDGKLYIYWKDRWRQDDKPNYYLLMSAIQTSSVWAVLDISKLKGIISRILNLLTQTPSNIEFDAVKPSFNIQFKNGCLCLVSQSFIQRTKKDFVTKILDYDYIKPDIIKQEALSDIYTFIKGIPDIEDHLTCLLYSITRKSNNKLPSVVINNDLLVNLMNDPHYKNAYIQLLCKTFTFGKIDCDWIPVYNGYFTCTMMNG